MPVPGKVSFIISVFNAERTLRPALDSLLAQTYPNWECVICDDASTDSTYAILQEYASRHPDRFVILHNAENKRLAYSLNRCLAAASGEYVARMDGDDISCPTRIEKQVQYLIAHPGIVLVGTAMQRFYDDGTLGAIDRRVENPDYWEPHRSNVFNHATILAYKYVYDQLGGYAVLPRTVRGQDRDLWFRFIKAGFRGGNMPEPLYMVREDREAIKRRTLKDYWISYQNTIFGYRLLNYPWYWYLKPTLGLLKAFVPYHLVQLYRKMQKHKRDVSPT